MAVIASDASAAARMNAQDTSWLYGPLAADLRLSVAPLENSATRATPSGEESNPLDMLAAPGVVSLTAEGPLEAPVLNHRLECADLRMGDHRLEKAVASLVASPLNWRQALLLSEDGNIGAAAPAGQDTAPVTGNDKNSRGKAATSLPGAAATANSSAPGSASDAGKNAAPATAKAGSPQDGQEAAPQLRVAHVVEDVGADDEVERPAEGEPIEVDEAAADDAARGAAG